MNASPFDLPEGTNLSVMDRGNILIVDDDQDQVAAVAYRLEKQGFTVTSTASGILGSRFARELNPNLIILDIKLPDYDGLKLCTELNDDPQTAATPIFIVSGSDESDIVRRARKAGSSFFLRKPYDPNALLVLIENTLRLNSNDADWSDSA